MKDESFKYTHHNPDGTKEERVGNNFDVYLFLKDKMELEIYKVGRKLQKQIDRMHCLHLAAMSLVLVVFTVLAIKVFI